MAIYIGTDSDGFLTYENEPDGEKTLFPNELEFSSSDKEFLSALESDVSDIQTELTLTSETFNFLGNEITLHKYGHIVQFDFFGQSKIDIPGQAETDAGLLPEGFRPIVRVSSDMFCSSTSARIQIIFNTDGTVKIYNHGTQLNANSGFIREFFTFIV